MKRFFICLTLLLIMMNAFYMVNADNNAKLEMINNNPKEKYSVGETFEIEVRISDIKDNTEVLGTAINYDDKYLEVKKVSRKIANDFATGVNPKNQIVILYSSDGNGEKLEDGILGTILFEVKRKDEGLTKLDFAKVLLSDYDNKNQYSANTNEITISIDKDDFNTAVNKEESNYDSAISIENNSGEWEKDGNENENLVNDFNDVSENSMTDNYSRITDEQQKNSINSFSVIFVLTIVIFIIVFFILIYIKNNNQKIRK